MECGTYCFMTHPSYLTYKDMLQDEEYWDDSLKQKYNQQQSSVKDADEQKIIVKEEYKQII